MSAFSLRVLSEAGQCLEIREKGNDCEGALFSHQTMKILRCF